MKKILSKILVITIILSIFSTMIVAADSTEEDVLKFSLQEAIQYALDNNNSLKITDITIKNQIDELEKAQDIKEQLNNINSSFSIYLEMSEALQNTLIKKGFVEKQQQYKLDELNMSRDKMIAGVKLDVEKNYYTLKSSEEKVRIEKDNLDRAKKEHEIVKHRFELGSAIKLDVLNSESQLQMAEITYQNTLDEHEYARMSFNKAIGLDLNAKAVLTDELEFEQLEGIVLNEKIDIALTSGYDYLVSEHTHDLAKMYFDIVELSYTSKTATYKVAKENLQISEYRLEDAKNNITLQVTKSYMDLIKAERSLTSVETGVALAKQAYEIAQVSYESGLNTALDVSKARIALREAELGYNQALLGYNMAIKAFEMSYK